MDAWITPNIHTECCTSCGLCALHCPTGALRLVENLPFIEQPGACAYCGICEDICPAQAIELSYFFSKE